jgi:ABC transport system ATP-binding/permease protein
MDVVNSPAGTISIQFMTGSLAGRTYGINKPITILGRDPGSDIVVNDPSVSRQHVRLIWQSGAWSIEKLSPGNTLMLNQREVQQAVINHRDTISMGAGASFLFLTSAETSASSGVLPGPQMMSGALPESQLLPPPPMTPHPASLSIQTRGELRTQRVPPLTTGAFPEGPIGQAGIPSLEISSNISREKQTRQLDKQVINIGREPSNDIVISEPIVSGFHAQIVREGNQLVFVHPHPNRQSTLNGLLYQGQHIEGNQPFRKPLARGDVLRIGDEHGTLVTLAFNDGSGASQDVLPEIRPIPLGAPLITLGRLPENTVVLNHPQVSARHARLEQAEGGYRIVDLGATNHVYVNAQQVSSQLLKPGDEIRIGPFKLTYTGTQLTQHDESNSVRIDAVGLKKVGNNETILINDVSIIIPPRKFVALVGGSGAGKSTLMDALNGLRPAQQGRILYNGQDYYQNLAAFSTQLGYVPQDDIVHRDLTVERALYYAARLRLPEDFTEDQVKQRIDEVLEDVEMTFRRHLPISKLSGGQRKRVSIALELLANPSVFFLDEPTSGLDPGLDRKMMFLLRKLADKGHTIILVTHATNNINACDYVCFLCQGGRLAYYGPPEEAKTYFGKADFAEIYSALEPTEQNKDIPAQAEARFRASPEYQKYVQAPLQQGPAGQTTIQQPTTAAKPAKRDNALKQFMILAQRYLELLRNDTGNLLILLLQAPVIGVILLFLADRHVFDPNSIAFCPSVTIAGLPPEATNFKGSCQAAIATLQQAMANPATAQVVASKGGADAALNNLIQIGSGGDAQKILFIMAFAAVMFGCINGAREIVKEAAIYRRERAVNLGIMPYLFSKIAVLGVLSLLQSAVLVLFVELKAPLQHGVFLPPVLETYITMSLTALAGLMVGLTVSAIAPNNDRAMSFIPIILIPQVIFSGIIFPLNNAVLKFLGMFFAAGWAMAGLGTSLGLHSDKLGGQSDCSYYTPADPHFYGPDANPGNCAFRGDYAVSVTHQVADKAAAIQHLLFIWVALLAMCIALGILTAYFLKRKDIRG